MSETKEILQGITDIKVEMAFMKKSQESIERSLDYHIKRTDLLESKQDRIHDDVTRLKTKSEIRTWLWRLVATAFVMTILGGAAKTLFF